MRKAVVIILIAALSLSMLAMLAGCGGDANKDEAKQLMKAGDNYMSAVETALADLEAQQADLATTALGGDLSSVTGEAGEALQEEVEDILDSIESNLLAAQAEYEKILGLDGVEDYKEYASKMIEAVDIYIEQLGVTRALVAMLVEALMAMAQGQDVDIIGMLMNSEELQMIDELGKQGDALVDEANKLKKDKKLES
jgi:hypothetical protein